MGEKMDRSDKTAGSGGSQDKFATDRKRKVSEGDKQTEDIDERRRALVRAGWAVPALTAVPGLAFNAAYAQSPHGDNHTDGHADATAPHDDHTDVPHDDHTDVPHDDHSDIAHADVPHSDTAHTDIRHIDSHDDIPFHFDDFHSDSHANGGFFGSHFDSHSDSSHLDVILHSDFHADFHQDDHGDALHQDTAHLDAP